MDKIEFIKEEVTRQGFVPDTPDFAQRVEWMSDAWEWASDELSRAELSGPGKTAKNVLGQLGFVTQIGKRIERQANEYGYRDCEVTAGGRPCPPAFEVPGLMHFWHKQLVPMLSPRGAYLTFELIHPFRDGNGRTGKVIYNMLLNSMEDPQFPPDYFGGGVP